MKTKKVPLRTCVVTKEKYPKRELIRVVRTPEKEVIVDKTGKVNGRGAYLKLDKEVIQTCKNKKILNHHLEIEIPDTIFDELEELVGDING